MELFKLLGTIAIDGSEANKELDKTSQKGEQTQSKLSKAFSSMGKGAVALGKTVGVGLVTAGAAMGTLTVKALNLGGELEQNMGGSEQVFKQHAGKMQETAKSAFSNMGLSTSDFLATANKMGALFQGAGFSIAESSDLSASAMQRAADVASIMGIDTSAAMEAIAGAAKGNFTMMDNLGVAMNDTTLQAYALSKGIDKSTQDMTNQEKIGLAMEMFMEKTAYAAGNYARENETLAGSLGTCKAALTNFLDGSGDVDQLVSSFSNLANVVVKNIGEIAPRLATGLSDIITQIMPMLPPLVDKLLPTITNMAIDLLLGLVDAMPSIMQTLIGELLPSLIEGIVTLIDEIIYALPQLMEAIISSLPTLIPQLVSGFIGMISLLCIMLPEIIQPIIDYLPEIIVAVVNALLTQLPLLIKGIVTLIGGLIAAFPQIFVALWEAIKGIFTSLASKVLGFFEPVKNAISNAWAAMGNVPGLAQLKTMIEQVWGAIKTHISTVINAIKSVVTTVWNSIKNVVSTVVNSIKNVISTVWNAIKTIVSNAMKLISSVLKGDWEGVKSAISNILNAIKSVISSVWNAIKNIISSVLNGIKNTASSIWNAIKSVISSAINTIKSVISSVFNGIKSTISNVFNGIKSTASSAWNDIKTKMTGPIEKARDKIKSIVDKIKGFFSNMKISLPKIKLPHFKVSGKLSISPPSVPKLSIDWYKKAMNNPMIMNDPTIFGYNPKSGSFMGGGEAGSEVVSGTNTLMGMIRSAVSGEMGALAYYMQQMVAMLSDYFPQVLELQAAGHVVEMDGKRTAKILAKPMDAELGKIHKDKERGQ